MQQLAAMNEALEDENKRLKERLDLLEEMFNNRVMQAESYKRFKGNDSTCIN